MTRVDRPGTTDMNLPVDVVKAIVGLRPSFSSHVRLGERGHPSIASDDATTQALKHGLHQNRAGNGGQQGNRHGDGSYLEKVPTAHSQILFAQGDQPENGGEGTGD